MEWSEMPIIPEVRAVQDAPPIRRARQPHSARKFGALNADVERPLPRLRLQGQEDLSAHILRAGLDSGEVDHFDSGER